MGASDRMRRPLLTALGFAIAVAVPSGANPGERPAPVDLSARTLGALVRACDLWSIERAPERRSIVEENRVDPGREDPVRIAHVPFATLPALTHRQWMRGQAVFRLCEEVVDDGWIGAAPPIPVSI